MRVILHATGMAAVLCAGAILVGCAHAENYGGGVETAQIDQLAVAKTGVDAQYDKLGFYTELDAKDGRVWVFEKDSEDLAKFQAEGRPARHVLRPGAGPLGLTLKSTEFSILDAYQAR